MIDKDIVRRNFNQHAADYDEYAIVQRWMGVKLLREVAERWDKLHPFSPPRRILELGCGTGALTLALLQQYPDAHITVIDLAERMIEATCQRVGADARSRLTCITSDIEAWASAQVSVWDNDNEQVLGYSTEQVQENGNGGIARSRTNHFSPSDASSSDPEFTSEHATVNSTAGDINLCFDLIISNATFQWFNTPKETCQALSSLLTGEGILAFATFGPNTFYELHNSFAYADMTHHQPVVRRGQTYLQEQAWRDCCVSSPKEEWRFTWQSSLMMLTYPSVSAFLHSVKRVGAGNALRQERAVSIGRRVLRSMEEYYVQQYSTQNPSGIQVTYDVGIGILHSSHES